MRLAHRDDFQPGALPANSNLSSHPEEYAGKTWEVKTTGGGGTGLLINSSSWADKDQVRGTLDSGGTRYFTALNTYMRTAAQRHRFRVGGSVTVSNQVGIVFKHDQILQPTGMSGYAVVCSTNGLSLANFFVYLLKWNPGQGIDSPTQMAQVNPTFIHTSPEESGLDISDMNEVAEIDVIAEPSGRIRVYTSDWPGSPGNGLTDLTGATPVIDMTDTTWATVTGKVGIIMRSVTGLSTAGIDFLESYDLGPGSVICA